MAHITLWVLCGKQIITTIWDSSQDRSAAIQAQALSFERLKKCQEKRVFNEKTKPSSWSTGKKWTQEKSISAHVATFRLLSPSAGLQKYLMRWKTFILAASAFSRCKIMEARVPSWKRQPSHLEATRWSASLRARASSLRSSTYLDARCRST